jgi:hypothetical protein
MAEGADGCQTRLHERAPPLTAHMKCTNQRWFERRFAKWTKPATPPWMPVRHRSSSELPEGPGLVWSGSVSVPVTTPVTLLLPRDPKSDRTKG